MEDDAGTVFNGQAEAAGPAADKVSFKVDTRSADPSRNYRLHVGTGVEPSDEIKKLEAENGNDFHAGWVETSSLLDIDESLVREGYKDLPDSDISDKDMIFKIRQLKAMGEYGHIGMPRFALKETGHQLNQNCIESICEAVINFYNRADYKKYDDYFLYKILPLHIGFLKPFGKVRRVKAGE